MEPQLSNPNFASEHSQDSLKTPEAASINSTVPEVIPTQPIEQLKSVETKEKNQGMPHTPITGATTLPTVAPTLPVDDSAVVSDSSNATTPTVAADDDVIEKEWVNKAKKVVSDTKGDPYRQEHEVSKLQADYMQKRYGKQVRLPKDI